MIRSIIRRQLGRNTFGIFKIFDKQMSEQQKTYEVLESQYQNAQNITQKLDIMKNIINSREQIDNQNTTLDDLVNYYKFIRDYKKCKRNQVKMERETTEAFNQTLLKFLDPLTFNKVQESQLKDSNLQKFDFLRLNQLSFILDREIKEEEYCQLQEILNEMVEILKKQQSENTIATHLMGIVVRFDLNDFLSLIEKKKQAEINMIDLLNDIREMHSYCLENTDTLKEEILEEDQLIEFLYVYETGILNFLVINSFDLNEYQNCVKYSNELLQLIKSTEGINRFYLNFVQQYHNLFSHVNYYRSLQLLEETCSQLQGKEDQFTLQVLRMFTLYLLNQVSQKDIEKLLRLAEEINLEDTNSLAVFYAVMLLSSARFQKYFECQKYIDILAYHYEIGDKFVNQLMECRYGLYVELKTNKDNPNVISVYKDIISYSEIKSSPIFQEVKRRFKEEYFELSKRKQCKLADDMRSVLQDQLQKGIFEDDQNLIRDTLEQTFKIIQSNPNYQYTLLRIFLQLKNTPTMTAQVIAQLSEYISLLEEDQKQ